MSVPAARALGIIMASTLIASLVACAPTASLTQQLETIEGVSSAARTDDVVVVDLDPAADDSDRAATVTAVKDALIASSGSDPADGPALEVRVSDQVHARWSDSALTGVDFDGEVATWVALDADAEWGRVTLESSGGGARHVEVTGWEGQDAAPETRELVRRVTQVWVDNGLDPTSTSFRLGTSFAIVSTGVADLTTAEYELFDDLAGDADELTVFASDGLRVDVAGLSRTAVEKRARAAGVTVSF
jgi:hypothetical protein